MEKVRLGEIFIYEKKSSRKAGDGLKSGLYPFFTSSNIQSKFLNEYDSDGEYLIFGTGGKASVNYVNGKFSVSTDNFLVKVNACAKYIFHYLKGDMQILEDGFKGASIRHISKDYLNDIKIFLPSHSKQERIAWELDIVYGILAKQKRQHKLFDDLIKSKFNQMFGNPANNVRGWEHGTIRDIVSDVKYGTSRPATEGGRYPYLRMNNITYEGQLDLSNLKYIDIPDDEVEKCSVREGDVLFNRTNSKELVGKTCVFNLEKHMIIAGYIIRIRVNQKAIPIYLSATLNSDYGKLTLRSMCKQIVGQANINAQELQNIEILIPPLDLQNQFADFVIQVELSKAKLKAEIEQTETLYKALMQKHFGDKEAAA
ncbi:MAG: restriction endonuclease subunit S [Firmicutes bacterium]|nr:restriction endonuclease subunit S [Bacillota bacterium]